MGVPKRKPSKSRQRMRRAYNSVLALPQLSTCPQCAAPYVPHRVGHKDQIHAALPHRGFRDHRVRVVHASEVLTMEDKPAAAVRKKKDCSIARAIELVREGKADAVVSLGNTGGIFAAATFKLGR